MDLYSVSSLAPSTGHRAFGLPDRQRIWTLGGGECPWKNVLPAPSLIVAPVAMRTEQVQTSRPVKRRGASGGSWTLGNPHHERRHQSKPAGPTGVTESAEVEEAIKNYCWKSWELKSGLLFVVEMICLGFVSR